MKHIDIDMVKRVISYDPETGRMKWKERIGDNRFNTRFLGKEAGRIQVNKKGYKRIELILFGSRFMAHRVAWAIMTGEQPPKYVDHINRDATDNRWSNLRDGTKKNYRNYSKYSTNTSGHPGVSWHKVKGKWAAHVTIDYKQVHVGYFENKEDASLAAKAYREKHGFQDDHCEHRNAYE